MCGSSAPKSYGRSGSWNAMAGPPQLSLQTWRQGSSPARGLSTARRLALAGSGYTTGSPPQGSVDVDVARIVTMTTADFSMIDMIKEKRLGRAHSPERLATFV